MCNKPKWAYFCVVEVTQHLLVMVLVVKILLRVSYQFYLPILLEGCTKGVLVKHSLKKKKQKPGI